MTFPFPTFRPTNRVPITFVARTVSGSDLTTYTFTGASIGTAAQDRVVIVCTTSTSAGSSIEVNSLSIGGNAATLIVKPTAATSRPATAIFALLVPTGTTADIAYTLSGAAGRGGIIVFTMTGTGGRTTPFHTSTDVDTNVLSTTLNIPGNGGACGVAGFLDTTAGLTGTTWVGLTETSDDAIENANTWHTTAASSVMTAETGRTVSSTSNLDADLGSSLCVASWAPA